MNFLGPVLTIVGLILAYTGNKKVEYARNNSNKRKGNAFDPAQETKLEDMEKSGLNMRKWGLVIAILGVLCYCFSLLSN